jgi:cytochrome c oxidase subunit 1
MEKHPGIHMPSPSYWPITLAFSLALIAIGVVFSPIVSLIGIVLLLVSFGGWTMENRKFDLEGGGHDE